MGAGERRMAIWQTLCLRRYDTVANLASEFNVSKRTLYYDVQFLSLIYPIESIRGRYYGGIKIPDWYTPNSNSFTPAQMELLLRLQKNAQRKRCNHHDEHHQHLFMAEVPSKTCVPLMHLENCIHNATGTASRSAERRMERRGDGTGRSDSRIPLTLLWQAGRDEAARAS